MDKFNYVIARMWSKDSNQLNCYTYHNTVFYGTMEDAEDQLNFIKGRADEDVAHEYRIYKLNDNPTSMIPKELILLRGLPGSGKSTLANTITNEFSICEADKFFYDKEGNYNFDTNKLTQAHKWCREQVEIRMSDNQVNEQFYPTIVVSNTFTKEWEMSEYFDLAKKYGYRVHTIIVENRHGGVNQHGVPADKLEQMKNRFEVKL